MDEKCPIGRTVNVPVFISLHVNGAGLLLGMASARLNKLLSLVRDAAEARFLGARSFVHELQAKHVQQEALGGGFTRFDDDGMLFFEYKVPEHACCSGGRLPLSAMLSIVDDTTSWASVGVDQHRRPGVSIALHAALAPGCSLPTAGQLLVFESRSERIGRTLGFQTCAVRDDKGLLLASARHIKLLEMGRGWALLFGPLFPVTRSVARALGGFIERPPPSPTGTLAELLAPEALEITRSQRHATAVAGYTVTPPMLNEVRILFGGCQAMLHEQAGAHAAAAAASAELARGASLAASCSGSDSRASDVSTPPPSFSADDMLMTSMDISFMSGAARGESLELRADAAPEVEAQSTGFTSALAATSRLTKAGSGGAMADGAGTRSSQPADGVSGGEMRTERGTRWSATVCSEARMRFIVSPRTAASIPT
jgi:acyl-coenzyme A thioesterase PaaI-like protein